MVRISQGLSHVEFKSRIAAHMLSTSKFTRLLHWKDVIFLLVMRDFKARYKHTRIGMVWSVASPVLFLLIFYFLFTKVINLQIPQYATYVFVGILAWNWMQTALLQAVATISGNAGLVNQPGFPLATLPVIAVASAFLNFLIALPLMLILAWAEGSHLSTTLLCVPIVMMIQFVFILGIAYIVAGLNVAFRDVEQALPILLQLGYYLTPVFFSVAAVPQRFLPVFQANPMTTLIDAYRQVIMYGQWPAWPNLGAVLAVSAALLLAGFFYFQHARYRFLEEL